MTTLRNTILLILACSALVVNAAVAATLFFILSNGNEILNGLETRVARLVETTAVRTLDVVEERLKARQDRQDKAQATSIDMVKPWATATVDRVTGEKKSDLDAFVMKRGQDTCYSLVSGTIGSHTKIPAMSCVRSLW